MKAPDDTHTPDFIGGSAPAGTVNRYQGGKNGAGVYQTIINHIPLHARYIEAFAGSAAVFRNMLPCNESVLIERDFDQAQRLKQMIRRDDRLRVAAICGDALNELIKFMGAGWWGSGVFVYLDPPYHPDARTSGDLYRHELTAGDHSALLNVILPAMTAKRTRWALSGYRCASYDDAAAAHGWHRVDYTAQTRGGPRTESLWMNYDPATITLHDHRYLGTDFRERERIQRKVSRWVGKLEKLPRHERGAIMAALSTIAISGDARSGIAGSGERFRSD